jgi:hypothetical protein
MARKPLLTRRFSLVGLLAARSTLLYNIETH